MLEDQVANLLQRYLGNYVRGLNKEALKISVWQGDVELKNMQLKPEALNALKLPVRVKAGFLGSVKLKVPWSSLGQDPVLVSLDRIFLLAEPETQVEGSSEDAIQEAKKNRIREMEMKLLERAQQLKSEMNTSWLGSLISTIIGNLKLSISNIHIRYEDFESNPGHPFAAGITLESLSAVTVDNNGMETFVTGGSLDRIQKSVQLDQLALYLDSDTAPWHVNKPWEDLLPSEWVQVFRFGTEYGKPANRLAKRHTYILEPVSGNAKYSKLRPNEFADSGQPLHKAAVNLDDVTLCLPKDGYRDALKLADNFAAFNQRLKYAHYRPHVSVKSNPRSWWKYAYRVVADQMKKASGRLSWDHVLKYASLRKRYISLYASLLRSDPSRVVVDDNQDIEELDRGLDIELILQWRMLAHKFVEQSLESDLDLRKQKAKKSWWSLGWGSQSEIDESEPFSFSEEDWKQLNNIIGYKESDDSLSVLSNGKVDALQTSLSICMKHNATKLIDESLECLAELSCEGLDCFIKLYPETKVFDMKLGSYKLSTPSGLLAESASAYDSLVGTFCYRPLNKNVDWSLVAKASPCYVTYLKDVIGQIIKFFRSSTAVSQTIALETAAAVQMTINGVKRTAQLQVNRALKDHSRFLLDLDIAAPKITIPTDFCPDNKHPTKLMLDLGKLVIGTKDSCEDGSQEELDLYLQFNLVLSDVSAFLVDGDYCWSQSPSKKSSSSANSNGGTNGVSLLPLFDKCGVNVNLQQIRLERPSYPSTKVAVRLPSLGFHFSPARYHRLMQIVKLFEEEDSEDSDLLCPWNEADFEGWLCLLTRKGLGNREAVWQRRYLCLVGPFLYVLESPGSKSYKQCISLRGKHIYQVPPESVGGADLVLAVCDAARANTKVVEDANALILQCDSDDSKKTWQNRLQGAVYRSSGSAPVTSLTETSSESEDSVIELNSSEDLVDISKMERAFITGVLDELKVCFSYSCQHDQNFMKVLLNEERRLFEFRAIGGQVELSVRASDMFIGTVLKSLEIEDLVSGHRMPQPCYLARSFIGNAETNLTPGATGNQNLDGSDVIPNEGDEFYEAPENLVDPETLLLKSPRFTRIAGLLPGNGLQATKKDIELDDPLDSFVKAQIVIYDQNSPLYHNIDMQVSVTLATLSFFCRRPTILAIMEFVNAITIEDESCESFSDSSSAAIVKPDISRDDAVDDPRPVTISEPSVKGLLGKGKSRVVFNLTLNMARAQIILMNEDESKLAVLSQDNLVTDIKVFPSSFSIKAALGNLRISDESLPSSHMYFWACDMRNPGGSSFVELVLTSFSVDEEDYEGYEFSLYGQLSEVRIVYLNRFIQEVASYFMGLVPNNSKGFVKLKDQVTNSEKLFTTSDFEGSPALKLDVSLRKPIILMPRKTDSPDYLKLDIVHITVRNTFKWFGGSRSEINAVHMEVLTVQVEDINLNVGTKAELGESIIQDVKGVSVVIRRSLRDLLHQIPSVEVVIKMEKLKAALSNREYQIITDCAQSNISETPHIIPPLNHESMISSVDVEEHITPQDPVGVESRNANEGAWVMMKVSVVIDLVELCLHTGVARDASLATVQISGAWLLYKSNTLGEGFLSATLKGFAVLDDREGTEPEFRLAVGKPECVGSSPLDFVTHDGAQQISSAHDTELNDLTLVPTMLILDAKFSQLSTVVSLCIQRPQLLVALDFLLGVVEFFVPTISNTLSSEEVKNSVHGMDAVILDQSAYKQPSSEFSLSPLRPLIADDGRHDHFVYDGNGGTLYLKDRQGFNLSGPSTETIIYIGDGKRLQFRNVVIKNGLYLDSCVSMGSNSSYSALKEDQVSLVGGNEDSNMNSSTEGVNNVPPQTIVADRSTEIVIELQLVGPELTFYNTSEDVGESLVLSNQLLHAQLDGFCRLVMKGDTMEMNANVLGLTMESNGITILEPFDTSVKYSNASGKTNIHLSVSDVFMNFSFSILRLFLAVEEDILAFLRTTSKKMTVVCSQFDKIGTIQNPYSDQIYAFWRPRAPPGFAVLGDYLTPLDKPPTKAVLAVNTNFARVKKPLSFKLIWPPLPSEGSSVDSVNDSDSIPNDVLSDGANCSIWFPEAPNGYVALGCVVSPGRTQPPLSSAFCILASLVSSSSLRDCIAISTNNPYQSNLAFWRVDNSVGTFLPGAPNTSSVMGTAYDLRHMIFGFSDAPEKSSNRFDVQDTSAQSHDVQSERLATVSSGRRYEAVASFQLIWWNQGSNSRKKLSIWRPVVPQGMVYFGDIAINGYEPPNTCIVLRETGDVEIFKAPLDFQLVGQVKKQRGTESISFWLPQAPPGFVSLGCIACKGTPKQSDFSSLRCIRSDMVTGDQFSDESVWDTSDAKLTRDSFSIWSAGNELGTFIVRGGFKKPPRRFALKLAESNVPSGSDDTVIDAEFRTFSAALFDDYSGLMVPLFNVSLSGIGFSLHGRTDYLNSTVSFSLAARSYNDKYEVWEPLIEPVDGFLRYQYDPSATTTASQLRLTSTRDLNLNVSVSNANMIIQAYASWNSLIHVHEYDRKREASSPTDDGRSAIDVHQKRNFYIIPQNKLGQDIFIRATELRGLANIIKMTPGDMRPVKVPVSKNMLDSHLQGKHFRKVSLLEAKLKLKPNDTGFIPEFVDVADGDSVFRVKIRQLSPAKRPNLSAVDGGVSKPLTGALKTNLKIQRNTGAIPPAKADSQQSVPFLGTRVCFRIGEFECPVTVGADSKHGLNRLLSKEARAEESANPVSISSLSNHGTPFQVESLTESMGFTEERESADVSDYLKNTKRKECFRQIFLSGRGKGLEVSGIGGDGGGISNEEAQSSTSGYYVNRSKKEFPQVGGLASPQYTVAIRLSPDANLPSGSLSHQQSARTCGSSSDHLSSELELVKWNEIFFFKVDDPDYYSVELIVTELGKGRIPSPIVTKKLKETSETEDVEMPTKHSISDVITPPRSYPLSSWVPLGLFSAPLKQIAWIIHDNSYPYDSVNKWTWVELSSTDSAEYNGEKSCGKIRCAVLLSPISEAEISDHQTDNSGRKSGFIQISPGREGPWTTVRLNYAAPAACWRLGNDVVASEVHVNDGNRYVNIRSLVSVRNSTDFVLDLCLVSKVSIEDATLKNNAKKLQTDEFFETEKYSPGTGWICTTVQPSQEIVESAGSHQGVPAVELPLGWEWFDDWHLDMESVNTADGWVYAPDVESLKWPESFDPLRSGNYARQRRWIRNRKQNDTHQEIYIGLLKPGDTVSLPLSGLAQPGMYVLCLRPSLRSSSEYSWSSVVDGSEQTEDSGKSKVCSGISVSSLTESEELLYCTQISGSSSSGSHKLWFCMSVQATEISKDIHSDPIQDWTLVIKAPLSISNFLPLAAEFSVFEMQDSGNFFACSRGVFFPGKSVNVYSADIRNPLFFSLLPQRGWLPINEAVLFSHPHEVPPKTISLRSSISGRIVQIVLEQNSDQERPLRAKIIRLYAPYWYSISRCPPLKLRLLDIKGKKHARKVGNPFHSKKDNETILEEITEEEIYEGHTIASPLKFKLLGLALSIDQSGKEQFGPAKDLSPLGDMDGSLDLYAYDSEGNCMRIFITTKPCLYQSVPTKVISIRPYMTFTNRLGRDISIKLCSEDEPKILRASDSRVSFVHRESEGDDKLQVRLEDTDWSFPVQIVKEDTIYLVLRKHDGTRRFLRTEIRGYEEGSRFIVVFRLGSTRGPIRIENRTVSKTIRIRQSAFGEDAWIRLAPLSTTNFSWEDPYGQKIIEAEVDSASNVPWELDLERTGICYADEGLGLQFHVMEVGDIKVARFTDTTTSGTSLDLQIAGNWGHSHMQNTNQSNSASPIELIIEFGVVGISIVDHRPKEVSYFYFERVFVSYSTGYDGGTTARFKLILGLLQLDNQLPLTLMPVLLAPEMNSDMHYPVFKTTITMRKENSDGVQVYPYVYIRVTDKCWRLNIHEPIIWALVDFYNNLQLDRLPKSSSVTEVDPEIRIDLIDVSEVRLKVSLETAPAQRPHGVLGVWSPILSAVGNAFKIQVHLRRVMHKDRFMRKSSIAAAIGNRIWRDLIHNPLHLIFSVDVLGMTSSTLASLSNGFAELSTDGQFLQLRSKQVTSRRITGVGDGIMQGTEALVQGVAFGVSGVLKKPVESARQNGVLGLVHGLGRAFLGVIVQPVSGALDFFSLTVDGIGASCSKCLEVFNSKTTFQRIRNPRAIHADAVLREYCEREAVGQMILYLAEAHRRFGCTELFKEPSKFALSDYYEDHFVVPYQRIVLVTNKRVMLLQCLAPDKMDKKPCKIMWDVPWEELMAVELAKAGCNQPSHLILHLKNFRRSENFVRVIKCSVEEIEGNELQAVRICSVVRKMWKASQSDMNCLILKVPSSQRHVYFSGSEADGREHRIPNKAITRLRDIPSCNSALDGRFVKHSINFSKIWSSEQESRSRCTLCRKQVPEDGVICSIWRPICPDGYVSIGDIARIGSHPPNVAAVYRKIDRLFALPVGYDLVWRNCTDDYAAPVSIWHPRAPEGYVSPGCIAMASFMEPELDKVYCVSESLAEETEFEAQKVWSAPESYPWACHIYQVQSDALHFVALRQTKEESDWKPMRILDDPQPLLRSLKEN